MNTHTMTNQGTYAEWTTNAMHTVKKDVLMTLAYIHDNRARDNARAYTSQQLDDVKDALCILHSICEIKKHMAS